MQPDAIHVLLVDDERLSRVVVGNLLRKCNYRVTVAESGLQALDALRHNPPGTFQLVLTDVMMPDVDGIELLRHVRQDDNFNSMPVVMMSANEHTDTVFECIRGGAEDYLLKPITKKEVQYIWQHVWRRQQQAVVRVPHIGPDEADDELRRSGSLPTDQQRGGAGVAAGQSVSMAAYFAQRKELVNSESSFRLFCGVLAMLRPHHARGVPLGKVRPSCLRLMGNGAISVDPEARCAHEHALYASPEELLNAPASVKSDIYSLGVLFFELFHPLTDEAERARVLGDLRHRILPMSVLQGHPQEAAFVVSLLHPDPRARPGRLTSLAAAKDSCAAPGSALEAAMRANGGNSGSGEQGPRKRRRTMHGSEASPQQLHARSHSAPGRAFPQLDETFFKRRDAMQPPVGESGSREIPTAANNGAVDHLLSFSTDLSKFARYNSLQVRATLKYGDLLNAADMVCCTAFDRDDEFFATAGVSRRIKIFEFASVLDSGVDIHYPVLEIPSRSKLSSVCWNSYVKSNLICADYEGMIQLWDVNANSESMRFEEHSKRVWSVDFSQTDPTRFLSGSDDGTVRLWSMSDDAAVACIDSKANVCSVQFSPTNSNLMAFGSANYRVYLYDLRQISVPLAVIGGHSRAVSYVRWMGGDHLVSASTDNNLKLWDVATATSSSANVEPVTTFTGHINEKNFVGLSVTADGFLACGSENNAVYTYYKAIPLPLTHHQFSCTDPASGRELDASDCHQFVSTVCWNRKGSHLIAANSLGNIQVLELV
ncbi:hypothetical protein WJX72_006926 [[Myrmecia] bisecta]|uniref:Response regulatory domain-containing protein n=1 Tax=[Myrmecia] bisecta TaxID=41462 RepID=A0AAW1QRC7_9CHLO